MFYTHLTAVQTSLVLNINRNTINTYYNKFRKRIVILCNVESPFKR